MITTGLKICERITFLLDSVTSRITAGGTASAVSFSEHFSRPRMETAMNGPKREATVEFMQEAYRADQSGVA